MPVIETDKCIACGLCAEACVNEAIDIVPDKSHAQRYKGYTIIQSKCSNCGVCLKVDCPSGVLHE